MNELVTITNLTKNYGRFTALYPLNLTIPRGRIIGLLGPNGSGKTTLIKLLCGLLTPNSGSILIDGNAPGVETKKHVSYLPERSYMTSSRKVSELMDYFSDFYEDFDPKRALSMLDALHIDVNGSMKSLSKGTKEKVQLVLVMARQAQLYLLDEPIAGVDPAARDYILNTILTNYNEEGTVLISTHLISDIEKVLDEAVFLKDGQVVLHDNVDAIREREGRSVDALFRDVFRAHNYEGGAL